MTITTRGEFTRAEIQAANDAVDAAADASDRAQDDFRRHEIVEMNAEADGAKVAKWGLIGLCAIVVLGMIMQPSRSRK